MLGGTAMVRHALCSMYAGPYSTHAGPYSPGCDAVSRLAPIPPSPFTCNLLLPRLPVEVPHMLSPAGRDAGRVASSYVRNE